MSFAKAVRDATSGYSVSAGQTVLGAPTLNVGPFSPDCHAGAGYKNPAQDDQTESVLAHINPRV